LANITMFIAEHGVALSYDVQDQLRSVEAHVRESRAWHSPAPTWGLTIDPNSQTIG
jgi:hypothetical protein